MKLFLQSSVDSHYGFTFGSRFCVTITELGTNHTSSSSQSVTAPTNKDWQYYVGSFLKQHSQQLFHSSDIAAVIDREQHWVTFK